MDAAYSHIILQAYLLMITLIEYQLLSLLQLLLRSVDLDRQRLPFYQSSDSIDLSCTLYTLAIYQALQ